MRSLQTVFPFTFSPVMTESSCCPTGSPPFVVVDFDYYDRGVVLLTEKRKKCSLKTENCVLFGRLAEDLGLGGRFSDSFEGQTSKK